jgi:hypothetical protein
VHCVLSALFATALPVLGGQLIHNLWVESLLFCFSLLFGLLSFYRGCFKLHKRKWPLILFLTGFLILILNHWLHLHTVVLLLLPATLMIAAHALNFAYCRRQKAILQKSEI